MKGILYIVSTPIGNLEDITLRALKILKDVDMIAAEDTRHSIKLLNHYGIKKPLISYWKEKEKSKIPEIINKLNEGNSVALISDAGTPGISDPGFFLINKAIEENIQIVPIPGPTAAIAALSISGLPSDEFTFIGFLPSKKNQRLKKLNELSREQRTIVIYEAPHRIIETLKEISEIFDGRKVAIVKEITKIHEEVIRGKFPDIMDNIIRTKIAGEYVLVIEGLTFIQNKNIEEALIELHRLMKKGSGRKEAVKKIANIYGISKKELYDRSIKSI